MIQIQIPLELFQKNLLDSLKQLLSPFVFHLGDSIILQHHCWYTSLCYCHLLEHLPQFFDFLVLKQKELFVKTHNLFSSLFLLLLLWLMYLSFQLTSHRASCQAGEDLISQLFLVSIYVAELCVCLYSHHSHIFDYFYMIFRACFPSIENRALASLQIPIGDLYIPLWWDYIEIYCD